jgi:hypothetical protein
MLTFEQFFAEHMAPLYAAEQARDAQHRDEAFVATTHTVCGVELRPMSPYELHLLQALENPFIVGGAITPESIAQYCALLAEPAPRGWWARRRFFRVLARQPYARAVAEIRAYQTRIFYASGATTEDSPSPNSDLPSPGASAPAPLSLIAPLITSVAMATGWSESELMSMPLPKLFQYQRAIQQQQGQGDTFYAPADRLISRALEQYTRYLSIAKDPSDPSAPSDSPAA